MYTCTICAHRFDPDKDPPVILGGGPVCPVCVAVEEYNNPLEDENPPPPPRSHMDFAEETDIG